MANNFCRLMDNRFRLVDFASKNQPGFRNNVVDVSAVPALLKKYKSYECYTTCFLFPENLKKHVQKTCKPCTRKFSVSGYAGPAFAYYLPIDIDSNELERAKLAAMKLVRFIFSELTSEKRAVLAYFSGSAGFHLMIDTRIFGTVLASENLHMTFAALRENVVHKSMVEKEVIDFSIKDKLRLWRLPNTKNRKSGLYKIQLPLKDLFTLNTEQVKEKARFAQPLFYTDGTGLIPYSCGLKTSSKAAAFFKESEERTKTNNSNIRTPIGLSKKQDMEIQENKEVFCRAEQLISESKIQEGYRNNAALRLTAKLRRKNFSQKKTEDFIVKWNSDKGIGLPGNELLSIVRSVYTRRFIYNYGCNDEILKRFCPYEERNECKDYRIFTRTKNKEEKTNERTNENKKKKSKKRETKKNDVAQQNNEKQRHSQPACKCQI